MGKIAREIGGGSGNILVDITSDGLADCLWIFQTGSVAGYKNGGPGSSGAGADTWIGTLLDDVTGGVPGDRDTIHFADVDGDGRADFHVIGDSGDLTAWLNSGPDDIPQWTRRGPQRRHRELRLRRRPALLPRLRDRAR